LVFQGLLHRLGRLIGAYQACNAQSDDKMHNCSLHGRRFNTAFLSLIRARVLQCARQDFGRYQLGKILTVN
jgi:hypothetical protein